MTAQFTQTSIAAAHVQPLLDGLFQEYFEIYHQVLSDHGKLAAYQDKQYHERHESEVLYQPPYGLFVTLNNGKQIIAMGAYKCYDHETAELKRIWTHPEFRKQGIAESVVLELERHAKAAGYKKIYLTTGFKQIAAVRLYLALAYQPLFQLNREFNFDHYGEDPYDGSLPFEKLLVREDAIS